MGSEPSTPTNSDREEEKENNNLIIEGETKTQKQTAPAPVPILKEGKKAKVKMPKNNKKPPTKKKPSKKEKEKEQGRFAKNSRLHTNTTALLASQSRIQRQTNKEKAFQPASSNNKNPMVSRLQESSSVAVGSGRAESQPTTSTPLTVQCRPPARPMFILPTGNTNSLPSVVNVSNSHVDKQPIQNAPRDNTQMATPPAAEANTAEQPTVNVPRPVTDQQLNTIRANISEDMSHQYFLPYSDMDAFAYSLYDDDRDDLLKRRQWSEEPCLEWPDRMREALLCGDVECAKKTLEDWCSQSSFVFDEAHSDTKKRLINDMRMAEQTSVLMAVCWDRQFLPCCSQTQHPWCGALQLLIDNGADVNERSANARWTPLMVAARRGALCQVAALLKNGADVGSCSSDGSTALHLAVQRREMSIVRWLVWHGADLNAVGGSIRGRSSVYLAARSFAVDRTLVDWLTARRQAVQESVEHWVHLYDFLRLHQPLSQVHMWPIFSTEAKHCRRTFEVQPPDLAAGKKGILFLWVRFVAAESDANPAEVFTDKTMRQEGFPPELTVRLNGVAQTLMFVDQGWIAGLEAFSAGTNAIEVEYDRPDAQSLTKLGRTCVLVTQPWLAQMNHERVAQIITETQTNQRTAFGGFESLSEETDFRIWVNDTNNELLNLPTISILTSSQQSEPPQESPYSSQNGSKDL